MRRFVATSLLVSAVLLAAEVCFAQDKQPAAAGAKAESQDMWAAYKKMWEGEWEATITMPQDVEGNPKIKKGDTLSAVMTDEVIFGGNGLLITRIFRNVRGEVISEQKGLANWCPKQKAIILREISNDGGSSNAVIKMIDGQEHNTSTEIDAQGTETVSRLVVTAIDNNTHQFKVIDGLMAGFEMTWKRKKG